MPQTALFVGMAVGLAAAPPGVAAFGRELVIYWREASVGHDQLAYYLGKSVSLMYRIIVAALHFSAMCVATPRELVGSTVHPGVGAWRGSRPGPQATLRAVVGSTTRPGVGAWRGSRPGPPVKNTRAACNLAGRGPPARIVVDS